LFQGRRELFAGLWIDGADYDWEAHPVVHISFSSIGYKDIGLEKALLRSIDRAAEENGQTLQEEGISARFRELIQTLGSGERKLVLLIDEYDKPLIDYIEDIPQAEAHRSILKNFFSVIKDCDPYIRFFLITGVSKFSKVSLFSDLNHLEDLTINPLSATLTGYTQAEVEAYFAEEITALQAVLGKNHEETLAEIRYWYNGYSWWGDETLYNPFSMLNLVKSKRFANYWWETGTPTFLLKLMARETFYQLEHTEIDELAFSSYDIERVRALPILFQTGYLTIKGRTDLGLYILDYPNKEVRDAMYGYLIGDLRHAEPSFSATLVVHMRKAFYAHDMERLMDLLRELFARIPYEIFIANQEAYYQSLLYLTFQFLGSYTVETEVQTNRGRIDAVVHTPTDIYVIEFKLDEPASVALAQIRERKYYEKYLNQGKTLRLLGISFSSREKSVAEWVEEQL
jgi:hypothetical protein